MNAPTQIPFMRNPVVILAFGIVSLLIVQILGPVTWYFASKTLKTMDEGTPRRGFVVAGRVLGMIATALFVLSILIFMLGVVPGI